MAQVHQKLEVVVERNLLRHSSERCISLRHNLPINHGCNRGEVEQLRHCKAGRPPASLGLRDGLKEPRQPVYLAGRDREWPLLADHKLLNSSRSSSAISRRSALQTQPSEIGHRIDLNLTGEPQVMLRRDLSATYRILLPVISGHLTCAPVTGIRRTDWLHLAESSSGGGQ
jgi:hypothetical protein